MSEIAKSVVKTQAGDIESFTLLVRRFQDMATGYAYSILKDFHLAEDAAQEAFLAAFRDIQKLREPEAFAGWFRQIIFTQCNRLTRRKQVQTVPLETNLEIVSMEAGADEQLEQKETRAVVFGAVQKLPERERTAILLFFMGGFSLREISDFLSVPATTVKSRLHKAKSNLRKTMMSELKESLREKRPSNNEDFVNKIRAMLVQAARGDIAGVNTALENDASLIDQIAPHPFWGGEASALHVAAEWGQKDVVALLLEKGADPNVTSARYDGWTPLHMAIFQRRRPEAHQEIIDLLISHGAQMDLWALAMLGEAKKVQEILRAEPELVHAAGPNGATPLHFAATVEAVRVFLENGADPKALNKYGKPPARSILGFGADRREAAIYLLDQTGEWDIWAACAAGDTKKIRQFVEQNPKLLIQSGWDGETPLNIAAHYGQAQAVKLLLDLGANANLKAESGNYPLHLAAQHNHISTAQILIDHQADLFVLDDRHQAYPKDWAGFQGHREMAEFLTKNMKI